MFVRLGEQTLACPFRLTILTRYLTGAKRQRPPQPDCVKLNGTIRHLIVCFFFILNFFPVFLIIRVSFTSVVIGALLCCFLLLDVFKAGCLFWVCLFEFFIVVEINL